jgi:copper oxidase (laccase) domain-containing protein
LKKEDKIELLEAGILRKNIEIMGIDTYKDHNYFSHRWHLANNAFPR